MSLGIVSGLGKMVIAVTACAGVVSPIVVFTNYSGSHVPLTLEKLNEFKSKRGFEACYPFLKEENKLSLLFVCLKKIEGLKEDKTHATNHFFYNSGSWEEALGLRKNPNSENGLLVETKGWLWNKERKIQNTEDQRSKLQQVGTNKKCQFNSVQVKGSHKGNRVFVCFEEDPKLKWSLQEFTDS